MSWQHKLLVTLSVAIFASCVSKAHFPPPFVRGTSVHGTERAKWLSALLNKSAEIRSFKALSRSRITYNDEKTSVRHAFVFGSAQQFRIETLPLNVAHTLGLMVAYDRKVIALNPQEREGLVGKTEAGMIKRVFGIPLEEFELASLLVGRLPSDILQQFEANIDRELYVDTERRTLFLTAPRFGSFYEIDMESLLLRSVQLRDKITDKVLVLIAYEGLLKVNDLYVPKQISFTVPRRDLKVELVLSSVSVNEQYPEKLFRVEVPEGYRVKRVE